MGAAIAESPERKQPLLSRSDEDVEHFLIPIRTESLNYLTSTRAPSSYSVSFGSTAKSPFTATHIMLLARHQRLPLSDYQSVSLVERSVGFFALLQPLGRSRKTLLSYDVTQLCLLESIPWYSPCDTSAEPQSCGAPNLKLRRATARL